MNSPSYTIFLRGVGRLGLGTVALMAHVRVATAGTTTLVADAYTNSSSPSSNYGAAKTLTVKGPPAVSATSNVHLQFDLSTLPPGTTGAAIGKATLTVFVRTVRKAQLDISLAAVPSFSGSLSADVTGTQSATPVARINGATLGWLGGATSSQALTFNGANWSPSDVVNSLAV